MHAVALRLALLALCLAAGAVLGAGAEQLWVSAVVGAMIAVRPHPILLAAAVAALIGMFAAADEHTGQLPILVLVTHALLRIGVVADSVSWRGSVELAVLRNALPGFLAVQVVAQAAAALALTLDGAAPMPWLAVGAVAGLAVLCWVLMARIRRSRGGR